MTLASHLPAKYISKEPGSVSLYSPCRKRKVSLLPPQIPLQVIAKCINQENFKEKALRNTTSNEPPRRLRGNQHCTLKPAELSTLEVHLPRPQ